MYMVGNFIGIPSPYIDGIKSLKRTKQFTTIVIEKVIALKDLYQGIQYRIRCCNNLALVLH